MTGTTLTTARLHLRTVASGDFEDFYALTLGDDMSRFLGPEPPSRESSFNRLLRNAGCWMLFGWGPFTVLDRDSGAYVGTCGLFRGLRGLGDDFDPYPEAGWVIARDFWSRGYATEAMAAILNWFEAKHDGGRSVCMISAGNTASESTARKLGYRSIGAADYKGDAVIRYAREGGASHPIA